VAASPGHTFRLLAATLRKLSAGSLSQEDADWSLRAAAAASGERGGLWAENGCHEVVKNGCFFAHILWGSRKVDVH